MPRHRLAAILVAALLSACGGTDPGEGPEQRVIVPPGASLSHVVDTLEARGIVDSPRMLRLYARLTGVAGDIRTGTYEFRQSTGYKRVLDDLVAGRTATDRFVVPEGFGISRIGPVLARLVGLPPDSVTGYMLDTATANRFRVPGPTLEGYLYPATYTIPAGTPLDTILRWLVDEHMRRWTPERQALADSAGLSHRDVVTLASIVEKEAKIRDEMPTIAAVYRNRLDLDYPLQADPTVQYALGEHQNRLLYAHIDSVANHPYNTYTHDGLPPGPIGAASARAIDAVLQPADVDYLYFVARSDGSHVFNRHLADHNRARERIRREAAQDSGPPRASGRVEPATGAAPQGSPPGDSPGP